jgi:hypothetical protein
MLLEESPDDFIRINIAGGFAQYNYIAGGGGD